MHIRPYSCEFDETSVLAIFDRTFPVSHSFLERREQTVGRQHLELLLEYSETLVAEFDGSVIGFITMDDEGYISALYVDRPHAGQGVGSALLKAAQDQHEPLRLHVFTDNVSTVQFYKARGFIAVDEDWQIDTTGRRHDRLEMESLSSRKATLHLYAALAGSTSPSDGT